MNLEEALRSEHNWVRTENGADALRSTESALVDFWGSLGAYRKEKVARITADFDAAYAENPTAALRLLFYGRDARGGVGERSMFRNVLAHAGNHYTDSIVKNITLIPFYGRFDDLYALVGTKAEDSMWEYVRGLWEADKQAMTEGAPISLLSKWLKSVRSSHESTRKMGNLTAKKLGYDFYHTKDYHRQLVAFRRYIDIAEHHISAKDYASICYETTPGMAMMKYKDLFFKYDSDRFKSYIDSVVKGESKMKSGVVTPVDVVGKYLVGHRVTDTEDEAVEAMWKSLPDYFSGKQFNALCVCDTSGSMFSRDVADVALALTMYSAEHNTGHFKDMFITFSSHPELQVLEGITLRQRLANLSNAYWDNNTDLLAACDLILSTAVKYDISQESMPSAVVIISDMQFDSAMVHTRQSYSEVIKERFAKAGYEAPNLIFWNAAEKKTCFHASKDENGVQLASGKSAAVFAQVCDALGCTPYEAMMRVVTNPRYEAIEV